MPNEITSTIALALNNGTLKGGFNPGGKRITQTTQAKLEDVVTVSNSAEQDLVIPAGSKLTAANQGILCMINLDPTNYVKFGPKSGGGVMVEYGRLYPGFTAQVPVAPNVVHRWIADTAPCAVQFFWAAK